MNNVDLSGNQETEPINISIDSQNEIILHIIASSNTDWAVAESESSVLEVKLDGIYLQDIVLYNGLNEHIYKVMLGQLNQGDHVLTFYFNQLKSSLGAEFIHLDSIEIIEPSELNIDTDILKYSPILYGRDKS